MLLSERSSEYGRTEIAHLTYFLDLILTGFFVVQASKPEALNSIFLVLRDDYGS